MYFFIYNYVSFEQTTFFNYAMRYYSNTKLLVVTMLTVARVLGSTAVITISGIKCDSCYKLRQ